MYWNGPLGVVYDVNADRLVVFDINGLLTWDIGEV